MIRTRILTTIGTALLAGSFLAYAQAPAPKAEGKARMGKHMDEPQAMHEACTGKRGAELQMCLGEQRKSKGHREHRGHGDKPKS